MNQRDVEDLLRERARRMPQAVLSRAAAERLREQLKAESGLAQVPTAPSTSRRLWYLAAAALLLAFGLRFFPWNASQPLYGAVPFEASLLDELGRPLERLERGIESALSESALSIWIELEPASDAYLSLLLYSAASGRSLPADSQSLALKAGAVHTQKVLLPSPADGALGLILLCSAQPIPARVLERHAPLELLLTDTSTREQALANLATTLSRDLGCTAHVQLLRR